MGPDLQNVRSRNRSAMVLWDTLGHAAETCTQIVVLYDVDGLRTSNKLRGRGPLVVALGGPDLNLSSRARHLPSFFFPRLYQSPFDLDRVLFDPELCSSLALGSTLRAQFKDPSTPHFPLRAMTLLFFFFSPCLERPTRPRLLTSLTSLYMFETQSFCPHLSHTPRDDPH
jgi:hypothetical protein